MITRLSILICILLLPNLLASQKESFNKALSNPCYGGIYEVNVSYTDYETVTLSSLQKYLTKKKYNLIDYTSLHGDNTIQWYAFSKEKTFDDITNFSFPFEPNTSNIDYATSNYKDEETGWSGLYEYNKNTKQYCSLSFKDSEFMQIDLCYYSTINPNKTVNFDKEKDTNISLKLLNWEGGSRYNFSNQWHIKNTYFKFFDNIGKYSVVSLSYYNKTDAGEWEHIYNYFLGPVGNKGFDFIAPIRQGPEFNNSLHLHHNIVPITNKILSVFNEEMDYIVNSQHIKTLKPLVFLAKMDAWLNFADHFYNKKIYDRDFYTTQHSEHHEVQKEVLVSEMLKYYNKNKSLVLDKLQPITNLSQLEPLKLFKNTVGKHDLENSIGWKEYFEYLEREEIRLINGEEPIAETKTETPKEISTELENKIALNTKNTSSISKDLVQRNFAKEYLDFRSKLKNSEKEKLDKIAGLAFYSFPNGQWDYDFWFDFLDDIESGYSDIDLYVLDRIRIDITRYSNYSNWTYSNEDQTNAYAKQLLSKYNLDQQFPNMELSNLANTNSMEYRATLYVQMMRFHHLKEMIEADNHNIISLYNPVFIEQYNEDLHNYKRENIFMTFHQNQKSRYNSVSKSFLPELKNHSIATSENMAKSKIHNLGLSVIDLDKTSNEIIEKNIKKIFSLPEVLKLQELILLSKKEGDTNTSYTSISVKKDFLKTIDFDDDHSVISKKLNLDLVKSNHNTCKYGYGICFDHNALINIKLAASNCNWTRTSDPYSHTNKGIISDQTSTQISHYYNCDCDIKKLSLIKTAIEENSIYKLEELPTEFTLELVENISKSTEPSELAKLIAEGMKASEEEYYREIDINCFEATEWKTVQHGWSFDAEEKTIKCLENGFTKNIIHLTEEGGYNVGTGISHKTFESYSKALEFTLEKLECHCD